MGQRQWLRGFSRLILVLALSIALPISRAEAQGTAVFSRIDVAGNQRIEADTIRVFAGIEPGEPVSPEELNLAVRRLFETGLFEDVQVMPEAGRLVITVVENPTINQIAFEGNSTLDDEELGAVVELRPRLAYSPAAAEADAQRIIDAYRQAGRYAAEVNPVIIRQPENRVDLVYEITEGRRTSVQRINFIGNQVFSDRRLRRVVQTRQANFLSFILGNITYDADRQELDRELLRQFYLERGYVDFQVLSSTAELLPERTGFFLSFTVSEGQRYNFGEVGVSSSIPGLRAEDFEPLLEPVATRGVYNVRQVERVIQRMAFQAGQAGYAFVDIQPRVTKNEAARTVDITFEMREGERVFIERIDISGNTRTLDRVIRRQFNVVEGDAFNAREVREAEDRIRGFGYFSSANVGVRPGSASDRALVAVEVEEQATGSLSLGGAFSSAEGVIAQVSLTERNFLGRGQTVTASLSGSTEFANVEFGFFEPAMFDRDLLAGFNIFYRERNFDEQSFQTTNLGIEPRVGFPLSENGRLTLRYRLSQDEIREVEDDSSQIIRDEQGDLITSAVGFTYAYDRRNSVVDPTAGFILTLEPGVRGGRRRRHAFQDRRLGAGLHELLRGGPGALGDARRGRARVAGRVADHRPLHDRRRQLPRLRAQRPRAPRLLRHRGVRARSGRRRGGRGAGRQPLQHPEARRELPAGAAGGVRHLRRRLRRRRLALGARRDRRQHGRGGRRLPPALGGGRQPLRRHAVRAAALQLRDPDPEGGLRRRGAVPVHHPDAVLSVCGGAAGSAWRRWRLRLAWRAVGPAAAQAGQPVLFLFINQERILTGSRGGRQLLAEEDRQRDALRSESRALDSAFEAEERRLTEQRPTLPPEEFRALADAFDARVVKARRDQDARASALAQEFDLRRRQFYARVAPILVNIMDRYGAKAIFDENSVLLADQSLEHNRGRDRGGRCAGPAGAGRSRAGPGRAGARAGRAGRGPACRGRGGRTEHGAGDRQGAAAGGHRHDHAG